MCHGHFERLRRTGVTPTKPILDTPEARLLAKVKKLPSGHWIWTGSTASEGRYGVLYYEGRNQPAHRVAWMLWRGPLADDQDVDHLCRRTLCVNPDHLEPKTHKANILCGESPTALNAAKTHCIHGHEFSPSNTIVKPNGHRDCVICRRRRAREATARYRARKRAAAAS